MKGKINGTLSGFMQFAEQLNGETLVIASMNWIPQGCDGVVTSITSGYFVGNHRIGQFYESEVDAKRLCNEGETIKPAIFLNLGELENGD
jgi:hypothetical protein